MSIPFLKHISQINCYSSLLYILKRNNANLIHALKNLNFEADFYYDQHNKVFTSIKLIKNMEAMGFRLSEMDFCNHRTQKPYLNSLPPNSWIVVGISCYYLPWHFLYKREHKTHYFPAHKQDNNTYLAHDPMYGWEDLALDLSIVEKYAYEVKTVIPIITKPAPEKRTPLKKLLLNLDAINAKIKLQLQNYPHLSHTNKHYLLQYVTSIVNNKYLANNFFVLSQYNNDVLSSYEQILSKWISFKLGIHKLNLTNTHPTLAHELTQFLNTLTTTEKDFYKKFNTVIDF